MDKIIVLADHSGENHELVTCLSTLFPECEIQIFSTPMESPGDIPVAPVAFPEITKGKNGKHSNPDKPEPK